ncbi:hypothetical protein D0T50_01210 [Bacteroides sp. 214]|uniref:hypothetical protein n=1 Tax=Bacteroides sp. 214 TaxID=2302935 RepID=UPI0013D74D1D|nr:hypothetical protein [Bacteroides sp. 214]NDW11506.1 hypothetical protein [Bacteroides sp. 214]
MKKHTLLTTWAAIFFCGILFPLNVIAQISDNLYQSDYTIDPANKGSLQLSIDNITFLKNNEYKGEFIKGYTLPGFWLRPTVIFYPLESIKLELGAQALRFWGAEKYPTFAYADIATWKGSHFQRGFHLLPYFRAQFQLNSKLQIVAGNLYDGANHRLIEPFYNPEMSLVADPESGVQLIYSSKRFDMDTWINWDSFIFDKEDHPEAFTVGISSRLKYNKKESAVHFYSPIQLLGQHRGGEIDVDNGAPVQMIFNGAAGLSVLWNINGSKLKHIETGFTGAVFYKQKGNLVPFEKGYANYAYVQADVDHLRLKGAFWTSKDFASILGNPMFGTVSTTQENSCFSQTKVATLHAEYSRKFAKGYAFGVDFDGFYHFPVDMTTAEGVIAQKSSFSFSFGVYFRINPVFLLKKF